MTPEPKHALTCGSYQGKPCDCSLKGFANPKLPIKTDIEIVEAFFRKLAQVGPDDTGNITIHCIGNPLIFRATIVSMDEDDQPRQVTGEGSTLSEALDCLRDSAERYKQAKDETK